ncbi:AMP-binding protein [Gilvimarinus algae]|uniref:AMP-binding protein n=1 Tax=Gilvimarinus algae TaxID=3058037 RepID=A0ABT8THH2_9GAMM|nr:AMP-binding protein [Gilvimarinus sp. SDUM040014]MDO3383460.1 AMP-binding protein [Gilvimarinus sp. SDUM040014]
MDCDREINLRRVALAGGRHALALTAAGTRSADELAGRVRGLYAWLRLRPEQSVGLWLASGYDFLCAFIALALAGKRIVMPHQMQEGAVRLMGDHFAALITDQPVAGFAGPQWLPAQWPAACDSEPDASAFSREVELVLFTSGSTGDPAPIRKTLAELESEIATLESAFGREVQDLTVIATVSHQHIYGLLHVLLWPLARAAAFLDTPCHYPEVLASEVLRLEPAILVSSPTHLSRLPESGVFTEAAERLRVCFSSGGLLHERHARAFAALNGRAPLEILGSTETGGVAWRRQSESSLWQALPGVALATTQEQCLQVRSAHLGDPAGFTMGDKVRFAEDGRFELLGRADTIVKVEGKRLSLTELQKRLEAHPWIEEARAAVVRGRRDEIGVVLCLLPAATGRLERGGRRALNQALREYLADYFEAPLLPRRWRYVQALPRNAQGKVLAADVLSLLEERQS